MSRAVSRWILACAASALALAFPPPLQGQVVPDRTSDIEAQLIQRIDSLLPLATEARLAAERAAAEREERERQESETRTRVDTIVVEGLRVIALPEQVEMARTMFADVLKEYRHFSGSPSLEQSVMTFQWAEELQPIYVGTHEHWRIELTHWRPQAIVERSIRNAVGRMFLNDVLATKLAHWVNAPILEPIDLSRTYRELASQPAKVSRACLEGEGLACWTALGVDGDNIETWYTPEERRELVIRTLSRYSSRYATLPEFAPCVVEMQYAECDRILKDDYWRYRTVAPLTEEARSALIWVAVERGGEGAWTRLRETLRSAPEDAEARAVVGEALQNASGLTAEELGEAWRELVVAHRPATYAGSVPVHWSALMWIALFAASAMRSTRWRLG